ncbi:unnamed protein product [Prorocentrum cordatum]|uniref:Uncharacterized protein n=1 Tax=Prorocentrum cordatum TaxID=2364126 RepID=A0ABN9TMS9_9DINO|nr:unnamed protein product [Polarella glacialis]
MSLASLRGSVRLEEPGVGQWRQSGSPQPAGPEGQRQLATVGPAQAPVARGSTSVFDCLDNTGGSYQVFHKQPVEMTTSLQAEPTGVWIQGRRNDPNQSLADAITSAPIAGARRAHRAPTARILVEHAPHADQDPLLDALQKSAEFEKETRSELRSSPRRSLTAPALSGPKATARAVTGRAPQQPLHGRALPRAADVAGGADLCIGGGAVGDATQGLRKEALARRGCIRGAGFTVADAHRAGARGHPPPAARAARRSPQPHTCHRRWPVRFGPPAGGCRRSCSRAACLRASRERPPPRSLPTPVNRAHFGWSVGARARSRTRNGRLPPTPYPHRARASTVTRTTISTISTIFDTCVHTSAHINSVQRCSARLPAVHRSFLTLLSCAPAFESDFYSYFEAAAVAAALPLGRTIPELGGRMLGIKGLASACAYKDAGAPPRVPGKLPGPPCIVEPRVGRMSQVLMKSYTSQCDLWSLGVIVFILLVGYMPFSGSSERVTIDAIKTGKYAVRKDRWSRVTPMGFDFVRNLLKVNPEERMTATSALAHPWLTTRSGLAERRSSVDESMADSLVAFANESRFRRACMQLMAWSLTAEERAEVREAFLEMDKDKTGTIKLWELKQVLLERFSMPEDESTKVFKALSSTTNDEEIHYSDFLAAMVAGRLRLHEELLDDVFRRFDTDGTGKISPENLKVVLGEKTPLDEFMREADTDQDGYISYAEFIAYLRTGKADSETDAQVHRLIDSELNKSLKSHEVHGRIRKRDRFKGFVKHVFRDVKGNVREFQSTLSGSSRTPG